MSLWLDEKYLRLLSAQLSHFATRGRKISNFRCPLCGDSAKHKTKARGYCFPKGNVLLFKCHNCDVSLSFSGLLKQLDRPLYNNYVMESMAERQAVSPKPDNPPAVSPKAHKPSPKPAAGPLSYDPTPDGVVALSASDPLIEPIAAFIRARNVPEAAMARLFGTVTARTFLAPLVGPEKASRVHDGEPYLVTPLRLPNGLWYGAQTRPIAKKDYVTFRWATEPLKVFGLEAWNPKKTTYVVEGPIDALFVPNAIAACGSDLVTGLACCRKVFEQAPLVFVWDNEPKNPQVCRHIREAIEAHEYVVIWPHDWEKDINDMVNAGRYVVDVLPKRTFQGTTARLEFESWLQGTRSTI